MAEHFLYNYMQNSKNLNNFFFGKLDSYIKKDKNGNIQEYESYVNMVKRAGSSNSPGYRLNPYIENGVGHEYSFAVINDFLEEFGEMFDGVVFISGDMANKIAVSMGSIYNRLDEFNELTSVKALSSFVDRNTQLRHLTKGNMLNIDVFAKALPGTIFEDIQKLMKKSGNLDMLSFLSTTKLVEQTGKNNYIEKDIFNNDGRAKVKAIKTVTHSTQNLFVQQDLRHQAEPKTKKQSTQLISNILVLPHATNIVKTIYNYQKKVIEDFKNTFSGKSTEAKKIEWLLENVDPEMESELYDLLKKGITTNDPGLERLIQSKIAATITKKAMEILVNRAATQEIPDPNGILKGRRKSKDGKHILLPQAGCSIPDIANNPNGIRYPQNMETNEKARQYILENKADYRDMFDEGGQLMEWEIENGIIPGEPIMLTRTPADHPHSHTIARATFYIPGNFAMLDKQSQKQSGSDFDGDQRFITTFYKKRKRITLDQKTNEGLANSILYQLMIDYTDVEYDDYIQAAINVNAYDYIIEKIEKGSEQYKELFDTINKSVKQLEKQEITPQQQKQVEELFDSNPELANQVYETLGFKSASQKSDINTQEIEKLKKEIKDLRNEDGFIPEKENKFSF